MKGSRVFLAAALLAASLPVTADVVDTLNNEHSICTEVLGGTWYAPEEWGAPDRRQWLCDIEGWPRPVLGVTDVGCRTQESPSAPYFADCGGEGRSRTSGLSAAPAAPAEVPAARAAPDPSPPAPEPEPETPDPPGQGEPGWTPPR